jgi:hypothetical protein
MAYSQVALSSAPAHSTDTSNPDYYVSQDGTGYDSAHTGSYESLIVDTGAGDITHITSESVGTVALTEYQYVTWVDDPSISGTQDYKRVTIVVTYSAADSPGRSHQIQLSAFLTPGSVTVAGATQGATQGTSSPTASATPSATASGSCSGDVSGPTGSFTILSGTGAVTGYTASTTATISLAPSDACTPIQARLSNDGSSYSQWFIYDSSNPAVTWTLTIGDGTKSVWAQFKDGVGNTSTAGPNTIILDQTLPTSPGTLTSTVSCSGSNRTVNLSWGVSTDANLLGYRIYKSVNGAGYTLLKTTSTTSTSDTDSKSLTSLSYYVAAYDKAGNEGPKTNVISLTKNKCS